MNEDEDEDEGRGGLLDEYRLVSSPLDAACAYAVELGKLIRGGHLSALEVRALVRHLRDALAEDAAAREFVAGELADMPEVQDPR